MTTEAKIRMRTGCEVESGGKSCCAATAKIRDGCGDLRKLYCTRKLGHEGDHHAHGMSGECYGIWRSKKK